MRLVTSPTARKLLTVLSFSLAAILMTPTTAVAAPPPAPGNFTGYGFDACVAPSQKVMDAWNLRSPFTAIGIYISGNSRYCSDKYQPNLSKAWVAKNVVERLAIHPDPRRLSGAVLQEQPQEPGTEEEDVDDRVDGQEPGKR